MIKEGLVVIGDSFIRTQLLIVGAGPYGLATAAYAQQKCVDWMMLGEPMGFWKHHMPQGMLLRSPIDWDIDPLGHYGLKDFLKIRGIHPQEVTPIPLGVFLDYTDWFQQTLNLQIREGHVQRLSFRNGLFEAVLCNGGHVEAKNVLVAPGFRYFQNVPWEIVSKLPEGWFSHTCECVDFASLVGKHCVIVGGRQSAFEWAALLRRHIDAQVHIVYRHETPEFAESDWSWVKGHVEATLHSPGWYRHQSAKERENINRQFWTEGRKKLEPWLAPVAQDHKVQLWPSSTIRRCSVMENNHIELELQHGEVLTGHHLILATGYQPDVKRVPYLTKGNLLEVLQVVEGFPILDEGFEASLPGLFFTGILATRDFGPFFGFVVGCRPSARLIVERIKKRDVVA